MKRHTRVGEVNKGGVLFVVGKEGGVTIVVTFKNQMGEGTRHLTTCEWDTSEELEARLNTIIRILSSRLNTKNQYTRNE